MAADDKQALSAEDLALVGTDDGDAGSDGPDKTADKTADKAPAGDKDKPAAQSETDDGEEGDDAPEKADAAEGEKDGDADDDRTHLDDDEDDDAAGKADGKKAADKKPAASAAWRDNVVKAAEAKLLKKAKTDDDKKAVGAQVDRLKKQLARYGSLEAAALAGMEAQEKLRAGVKTAKPDDDATSEEKAAWREANGLPPDPKDYDMPRVEYTMPDGSRTAHKWSDRDQPLIDSFKEVAYQADLPQEAVNKFVNWYVNAGNQASKWQNEAISAIDKADKKETREDLKTEFGEEFKGRTKMFADYINDTSVFPEDVSAMIWQARTPDGHLLVNNAHFIKHMAEHAVDHYGEGAMVSGDSKTTSSAARKKELQEMMRTKRDEYYAGGFDREYLQIVEQEERAASGGRRRRAA